MDEFGSTAQHTEARGLLQRTENMGVWWWAEVDEKEGVEEPLWGLEKWSRGCWHRILRWWRASGDLQAKHPGLHIAESTWLGATAEGLASL